MSAGRAAGLKEPIDWSQLWCPGPTRVFTPAELARAGNDRPSRTLVTMVMINMAIAAMAVPQSVGLGLAAGLIRSQASAAKTWRARWRRRRSSRTPCSTRWPRCITGCRSRTDRASACATAAPAWPPGRPTASASRTRARLAQPFGAAATFTLQRAADGGTLARIECPFTTTSA